MSKKTFTTKDLALSAVVAALYVAMTWAAMPLSYMGVQFRLSEVLVLLCFFNRKFCPALIVGCLLANFLSPFAALDMIVGTLGTAVAVLPMKSMKNIWLAALLPVAANGILVGWELSFTYGLPLLLTMGQVALGELVVVVGLGVVLMKALVMKNKFLHSIIAG